MRRRAIGLGLLGVGAFLLTGALAVRLFLAPALVKLPLDQQADPRGAGTGVTYFDIGNQQQLTGVSADVWQRVRGDAKSAAASGDVAVWNFGQTISNPDGALMSRPTTYRVCLDRRTAEAVDCAVQHLDYDREATIKGLTLTFPFGTEQRDYDVFNPITGKAYPAKFAGTGTVRGLDVYRFETTVPATVVETTEVTGLMAGVPDQPTVKAAIVYSNKRTMWVEPTSGVIVSSEEQPRLVVRSPDGGTGVTMLAGTFKATEKTVGDQVTTAEETRGQITTVTTVLPLGLAVLGLVGVVAGGLLLRRAHAAAAAPAGGAPEVLAPAAAHRTPQVQ